MPMTCPACGEFEVFVVENPNTERDEIRCLVCDWSSPDVPPSMIAMLLSQADGVIDQIKGGAKMVSEAELVGTIVEQNIDRYLEEARQQSPTPSA